jgi:hypothetical protein
MTLSREVLKLSNSSVVVLVRVINRTYCLVLSKRPRNTDLVP